MVSALGGLGGEMGHGDHIGKDSAASLAWIEAQLAGERLTVLGGFHPGEGDDGLPAGTGTLLLIGPAEPGFWPHLTAQPEWESHPDPVDAFSRRVIGRLACDLGAKALFPFGGPPYHPFYRWALRTGRVFASPVNLLVHCGQGLLVSFRGALALGHRLDGLPQPVAQSPCQACPAPCLAACPAGAMSPGRYDVGACHGFLDLNPSGDCLGAGCLARRACPAGRGYARLPEQSAYHMRRFHGASASAGGKLE